MVLDKGVTFLLESLSRQRRNLGVRGQENSLEAISGVQTRDCWAGIVPHGERKDAYCPCHAQATHRLCLEEHVVTRSRSMIVSQVIASKDGTQHLFLGGRGTES